MANGETAKNVSNVLLVMYLIIAFQLCVFIFCERFGMVLQTRSIAADCPAYITAEAILATLPHHGMHPKTEALVWFPPQIASNSATRHCTLVLGC
jgi:hypothetical protein